MKGAKVSAWLLSATACIATAREAKATGFTDIGQDIVPRTTTAVSLSGYYRVRAEALDNLDLDRGPTPSGQPLFPVSLSDPKAQVQTYADMRLRTDLAVYAPGSTLAVKARFDILDNAAFGSNAEGIPSASTTQLSPTGAVRAKRVYAEVLTPVGLLTAGRMGNTWGLGMLANGGDCADCDSGDAADRIAFVTPVLNHIVAVAYDFTSTGPLTQRKVATRAVDIEASDNVHTVTAAFLRYVDPARRERRRLSGRMSYEYGAYGSYRWQKNDVPAGYLPTSAPVPLTAAQVVSRNFSAGAIDGWARLTLPWLRLEAEAAVLVATVEQGSLIPGVRYNVPVKSRQIGAALESEFGALENTFGAGLDAGYASGDPAPGFGATTYPGQGPGKPGDLEGAQASPPRDSRVDNFRFHPDYRIDRILFREIIGTVTDAVYLRPHARATLFKSGPGELSASLAAIASWAVDPASAPGQKSPLGVEFDPTIVYSNRDGYSVALEHAVLLPLAGLDNPVRHLPAQPAQLVRLRLFFAF